MPRTYGAAIPSYKLYKKSLAGSHMHKYMYWNLHIIKMFIVHVGVLFNRNNTIFIRYNLHIQAMKLSLPTLLCSGSNCWYLFSSDKNDLQCTVNMDIRIFSCKYLCFGLFQFFWKYMKWVCLSSLTQWNMYFVYIDFLSYCVPKCIFI